MLQAATNKHSLVRRRLCDLHCMVVSNCFCHFVVRMHVQQSIDSQWCVVGKCFGTDERTGSTDQ